MMNNTGTGSSNVSEASRKLYPYLHDITKYHREFEKLHLMVNNGTWGTVFSVQKFNAEVFAARHVKSLEMRGNVREEASILYQVRNAKELIQMQGLYEGPNHSVLVLDYLCGGDLAERVSKPEFVLNETKCKRYVRQICSGLEYVHRHNILHLDLKPFSIIFVEVDDDSQIRIADFGLAKRLDGQDDSGVKIKSMNGTFVEFLAPEMIECTSATAATDNWSVGIIAYMLVTGGKSPFYGGNRFRTISRILTCQYELNTPELLCISDEAKAFISSLLQPSQRDRMTATQCLQHKWLSSAVQSGEALRTLEVK